MAQSVMGHVCLRVLVGTNTAHRTSPLSESLEQKCYCGNKPFSLRKCQCSRTSCPLRVEDKHCRMKAFSLFLFLFSFCLAAYSFSDMTATCVICIKPLQHSAYSGCFTIPLYTEDVHCKSLLIHKYL